MSLIRYSVNINALERQDLSHTYLAHHELESEISIIIIIIHYDVNSRKKMHAPER